MSDLELLLDESPDDINLFVNNHPIGEVGAVHLQRHISTRPGSIRLLELKGSTIGPKGAEYLAVALSGQKAIRHVGLARNAINNSGAIAIVRALAGSAVETLDFEWNTLQDPVACALAKLLEESSTLVAVTLERNDIRCDGAAALAGALRVNKSLRNLNLGFNKIGTSGAIKVGEMLEHNSTLLTLNLAMNGIYPEGARALAEGLSRNVSLRSLNLQSNQAIDAFAELGAAVQYGPALKELNFASNRLQGGGPAAGFARGLRSATGLIALSLAKCGIGEPAITPVLVALASLTTLVTLDVSHCGLSAASATHLAQFLGRCPSVRALYLDDNRIEAPGGAIVAEALSMCSSLTILSLNGCLIGPAGGRAVADNLRIRRGLPIQELRMAYNHIGDDSLYVLCDVINMRAGDGGECALQAFDVSGNELTGRACSSLARTLKLHQKLASVTIRDNKLSDELHGISFLTLERALEYAGKDVLHRLQGSSGGGHNGDGAGPAAAAVEKEGSSSTASAAAHSAVYSNFNGTSAAFVESLAVMSPEATAEARAAAVRRTAPSMQATLLPLSYHDAAAQQPRRPSPVRQLRHGRDGSSNNSSDSGRALAAAAVEDGGEGASLIVAAGHTVAPGGAAGSGADGASMRRVAELVAASMAEEVVPGLAPTIPISRQRTQLHHFDRNATMLPISETQLRIKFTELDTDSDGLLDANEFALLYQQMDIAGVDPAGRRAKRLVKEHSTNGRLSFEQFSVLMLKLLQM